MFLRGEREGVTGERGGGGGEWVSRGREMGRKDVRRKEGKKVEGWGGVEDGRTGRGDRVDIHSYGYMHKINSLIEREIEKKERKRKFERERERNKV